MESWWASFDKQLQKLAHGVELIDVIGRAVAGESEDGQAAGVDFANLLHAARSPSYDGRTFQAELLDEVVGCLSGARERPRKNLGVREHESFRSVDGGPREFEKRLHRGRIDFAIADIASVQAV